MNAVEENITLEALDQQLAALESADDDLQQQHEALLAELGAKLDTVNAKATADVNRIGAILQAIPGQRQRLQQQKNDLLKASALSDYERLAAEGYFNAKSADEMGAKIDQAQRMIEKLTAQQIDFRRAADDARRRRSKLAKARGLSTADTKQIDAVYSYVELSYPNRDALLEKRAARGEAPPDYEPPKNGKHKP